MRHFAARTCTVLEGSGLGGQVGSSGDSCSIEQFRNLPAYVLLGAPGAGKTRAFEKEADDTHGTYVAAGEFLDIDDKLEWHGTTLFIDGLDEVRAGTSDKRKPLGRIRGKLHKLNCPRFRLACREADWLGTSDRDRLNSVLGDNELTVLQLNPLSEEDVVELLRKNHCIKDAEEFVRTANDRGLAGLLENPLSLKLLSRAVGGKAAWPKSRKETFELACNELVSERNQEHLVASGERPGTSELIGTAGRLCAFLLLSGADGYALPGGEGNGRFIGLEQVPWSDRNVLRHALQTRLFTAAASRRLCPIHRQISEFLAGKYLANLVNRGLPTGRILALITGFDGKVVSELRGLSAGMASHSNSSRLEVIERDPLGTVIYGDVLEFSTSEKVQLLNCLEDEAELASSFFPSSGIKASLANLATPDMEEHVLHRLTSCIGDGASQPYLNVLLWSLENAPLSSKFLSQLVEVVRDERGSTAARLAAIDVLARNREWGKIAEADLVALLEEIGVRIPLEPNDEVLGTLLSELYPSVLTAEDALGYLHRPQLPGYMGRYCRFWVHHFVERSTPRQLSVLIEHISKNKTALRPVFGPANGRANTLRRVPLAGMLRLLKTSTKEELSLDRLVKWIHDIEDNRFFSPSQAKEVGDWLKQNQPVAEGLLERLATQDAETGQMDQISVPRAGGVLSLNVLDSPGRWCLDRSVCSEDVGLAIRYFRTAMRYLQDNGSVGELTRSEVERCIAGNKILESEFRKWTDMPPIPTPHREANSIETEEEEKRRSEFRTELRRHSEALRQNRGSQILLHNLARAAFGEFLEAWGPDPRGRLRNLIGNDRELLDAVLLGLSGALRRSDTPTAKEITDLVTKGRSHPLVLPILAGLEASEQDPDHVRPVLDKAETRTALTAFFSDYVPATGSSTPSWFKAALEDRPELAAECLVEAAAARLRSGRDISLALACSADHAKVANLARLPLLRAFPVRCRNQQLESLGILLREVLLNSEPLAVLELVRAKLACRSLNPGQRAYWLAAGMVTRSAEHLEELFEFVADDERRLEHLADFLVPGRHPSVRIEEIGVQALLQLINELGTRVKPRIGVPGQAVWVSREMEKADFVEKLIDQLSAEPSSEASDALLKLRNCADLGHWHSRIKHAARAQRAALREAKFEFPSIEQLARTFDNREPGNAGDLHALTVDRLTEIAQRIRTGNSSDWHQYWNVDQHNKPVNPKPENACRDVLLSDLRMELEPLSVSAEREGQHADDRRSDILVSRPGFSVPIEIKRSCHPKLWSSLRNQLIEQYLGSPESDGFGIYLVFWFGKAPGCRPTPGSGSLPGCARDVEQRLGEVLAPEERFKISICVLDVSARGQSATKAN